MSLSPSSPLEIAESFGLSPADVRTYAETAVKLPLECFRARERRGALVLVSALNPTPSGEGKTTVTIGLGDALRRRGQSAGIALREPSLGPVMGKKGGGTGGGRATVEPRDEINLHFTHDFSAVASAHNLLAALCDNALYHDRATEPVPEILFRRVIDHNDRALRRITSAKSPPRSTPRETGFDIVAASEVMAILCLSRDLEDLKARLAKIILGIRADGTPFTAGDIGAQGAMTALLHNALEPNLVCSAEGTPAFLHGGPFANIAHGTNSLLAMWAGLSFCDVLVTEAGFGVDLGAEKFFDLVCPQGGFAPAAVVVVATLKCLKTHGGASPERLEEPNLEALTAGLSNLDRHLETLASLNRSAIVTLNQFAGDDPDEIAVLRRACEERKVPFAICRAFEEGGSGAEELADLVIQATGNPVPPARTLYAWEDPVLDKIQSIASGAYGAASVEISDEAGRDLERIDALGLGRLPICMAKTPLSLTHDPSRIGRPRDFALHVRRIRIAAGAGFLIPLTGTIVTMPGLPPRPRAADIDVTAEGRVTGVK